MTTAIIDTYLADCTRSVLRVEPVPPWPSALSGFEGAFIDRVAFHGIGLLLVQTPGTLDTWPALVTRKLRKLAGVRTFWEKGHRAAIASLLDSLAAKGIRALVLKGTALAYSVYADPAVRHRGDTDIFLPAADRRQVRSVLSACGFWETGDNKALQETWQCGTGLGFEPAVDIHWRINASAAISQLLESELDLDATVRLDRLASGALGLGAVDNFILIAINRGTHGRFGYYSGDERLFESDRLIWAVDAHLLATGLDETGWDTLVERAVRTGTTTFVSDTLAFAQRTLGTLVPQAVREGLAQAPADHSLVAYLGSSSHVWRLRRDVAACTSPIEAARVLRYVALPNDQFMQARFPDASGWPRPALHLRRWAEGAGKLITGKI